MDEQGLQNLLALGFTYEDLYKRGLLVLKPAEQKQNQQQNQQNQQQNQQNQQQNQQDQQQNQQDQQQNQQGQQQNQQGQQQNQQGQQQDQQQNQQQDQQNQQQDAAAALTAVLESFKDDLIKAIQKTNLRDTTRDENKKLSLDDAIAGLMKGDSSNG